MHDFRTGLKEFNRVMLRKLIQNGHKGGWEGNGSGALFDRVKEECIELSDYLIAFDKDKNNCSRQIIRECADIANFCMMIADNYSRLVDVHENH